MTHYEKRHQQLASPEVFRARLLRSGSVGLGLIAISLAVGIVGYMGFEKLGFLDAFLNASMILSGMGPLHVPESAPGKLFAGIYALYSGFAVLAIAAVMFAPVIHRLLHRFHIEEDDEEHSRTGQRKRRK